MWFWLANEKIIETKAFLIINRCKAHEKPSFSFESRQRGRERERENNKIWKKKKLKLKLIFACLSSTKFFRSANTKNCASSEHILWLKKKKSFFFIVHEITCVELVSISEIWRELNEYTTGSQILPLCINRMQQSVGIMWY
jgi:hypothetical protein